MKTIALLLVVAGAIGCASQPPPPPHARRVQDEASFHHRAVQMRVGWFPYSEQRVVAVGDGKWHLSGEAGKKGLKPAIVVDYPDTSYTLSLDMDIDNALLGKLLKHSLMTQKPITWPLQEYLVEANCNQCHPAHVELPDGF